MDDKKNLTNHEVNKVSNDIVLVFAHPDDEVLWASSMLKKATKIITCFLDNPDNAEVSSGRRRVIKSYPLANFINLGVKETGVFGSSNWRSPVDTEHGVLCSTNYQNYLKTFDIIKSRLLSLLSKGQTIVTHNPWGEYGHEEHILVYKVVQDISNKLNLNILVSGYVSNRSLYLMNMHIGKIGGKYFYKEPNHEIVAVLKKFYQSCNCWTMPDDYQWPTHEIFYEIVNYGNVEVDSRMRASVPMNIILFNRVEISYKDIVKYFYHKTYGNVGRWLKSLVS
jgi:hypothetical protein